jgi:hypothetical protein
MVLYSDLPARRTRQVLGDLLLVAWVAVSVWLALQVHDKTLGLAAPGRRIASAGASLGERLRDAGATVDDIPLVGDGASRPFDGAGGAADQLAAAGRSQVSAVESLAFWLALAVAVVPIVVALAVYLPRRVAFVRQATAGRRLVDQTADLDLFALRAMAHQPLHVLAGISADPAGAWRARDPDVVRRLAALELRSVGLGLPPG